MEDTLQYHPGPRVTPADIEACIASEHCFTAADGFVEERTANHGFRPGYNEVPPSLRLLTFCVLVLKNGFTVTGESACVSPENFNAKLGREIARANAIQKVWPLLGFRIADRRHPQ